MEEEKHLEEMTKEGGMRRRRRGFQDGIRIGILFTIPATALLTGLVVMASIAAGALRPVNLMQVSEPVVKEELEKKLGEIDHYISGKYIFDVKEEALTNGALKGYVAGLGDIYSGYFTAEEYRKKLESSSGSFVGIGIAVQEDETTGMLVVRTVYAGGPAEAAGMQDGDIIIGVGDIDTTSMEMSDVVSLIKGAEGTDVTVKVLRGSETLSLPMTRATVNKLTVSCRMLDDTIGYISLVEFDTVSVEQMQTAIEDLRTQGMKKLILDLRGNPGGALNSVLGIADLFLPETNIFYAENKSGERTDYPSTSKQLCTEDMVILVDGDSASASEVLSGSLQDHGRAVLVGEQTYGKGIIQSYYELSDGSAVKLTIAHYFTPNGRDIHGVGITPDHIIADDPGTPDVDEQLEAAVDQLKR